VAKKIARVEEYLSALPTDMRKLFTGVRKVILAAAPMAEEKIGYGFVLFIQAAAHRLEGE
jgi:uncharacterized protein YdhG (YjbR/CyaY superfamily)